MAIELRNPHSVLAALQTRPESVLEIRLATDSASGVWQDVVDLAKQQGVRVSRRGHQRGPQRGHKEQRGSSAEATLKALKIGPVTLKQRIAEAGGTLRIRSTEAGAHLEIGLPLRSASASSSPTTTPSSSTGSSTSFGWSRTSRWWRAASTAPRP